MIKIHEYDPIDLVEIESLRKWIEYMPECYTSNLDDAISNVSLNEDVFILHNINNLYSLIEEVTGNKPNVLDSHFDIGETTFTQYDRYNKLKRNIPSFDLQKYAKLKLTKEEQEICYSFVIRCTLANSDEIMQEIEDISNYYLRSYAKYLLIYSPESNYRFSIKNIGNRVRKSNKRLEKKINIIRRKETEAWESYMRNPII